VHRFARSRPAFRGVWRAASCAAGPRLPGGAGTGTARTDTSVKAVLGSAWRASFFLLDDVDMAVREKAAELARGLDDVSLPPLRSLQ